MGLAPHYSSQCLHQPWELKMHLLDLHHANSFFHDVSQFFFLSPWKMNVFGGSDSVSQSCNCELGLCHSLTHLLSSCGMKLSLQSFWFPCCYSINLREIGRNKKCVFHGHSGPDFFPSNYFGRGAFGCFSPCLLQINTVPGLLEDLE